MWNLMQSNKIISTQLKTQSYQTHLKNLANMKSTIKNLTPWKPNHSISKINNKYTHGQKKAITRQNNSLLNRIIQLQYKPSLNTTNIIPQNFPSNTKTHALFKQQEKIKLKQEIQIQNDKILKKILSAQSLYGKDTWKEDWQLMKNYKSNISRKESIPNYKQLAKNSSVKRPTSALVRF